jgi:lincosamide nucleotidyltransferase A/C/D/E
VAFDENGDGRQPGFDGGSFPYPRDSFTTGRITGRQVGCLSVEQQLRFHSGYEPRAIDLADIALLRSRAAHLTG